MSTAEIVVLLLACCLVLVLGGLAGVLLLPPRIPKAPVPDLLHPLGKTFTIPPYEADPGLRGVQCRDCRTSGPVVPDGRATGLCPYCADLAWLLCHDDLGRPIPDPRRPEFRMVEIRG